MSRRTLVNLVFFLGVFVLMLAWAARNIITIDALERPYEITADFAQTSGVLPNAEVTYLGVSHGRVSKVERIPEGVRITMKIDRDKEIPAASIARIFRKSAIGEPYIDFVPSDAYDDDTPPLAPGDHVPIERTTVPLEFSELLRSASDLIASIEPAEAASLLRELAAALDGRGDDLRAITTAFDRLTSSFASRTEQLDRLAENNTRLTSVLADHRLSLGQSMSDLRALAELLERIDGDTRALLDVGPDFLGTTADVVAAQKQNLDCLLTDLDPILRTLAGPDQLDDLSRLLVFGPIGFGYAAAAVDHEADGPWLRVNLLVEVGGPPAQQYVPPRSLPAVPTVPACESPLVPVPVTPASAGSAATAPVTPSAPAAEAPAAAVAPARTGADATPDEDGSGPSALAVTGAAAGLAAAVVAVVAALAIRWARRTEAGGG
ncbi:MAG TPA: MCE family protein [Acidimicrobiales bacterium]|nr:MCE family protein [Acidimicrobiales bacterium]